MERLSRVADWRARAESVRASGRRVGLVPTMGALHAGHESLMRAAAAAGDVVFTTLFVNPRQFNNAADLATYPRTPDADASRALAAGTDVLVEPALAEMWPLGDATPTTVHVGPIGDVLEGADRPGHFDGVASVVAKLLIVTGPCRLYLGEKDFQQLVAMRQMVRDLSFDVDVVGCPIVREETGLALSSRNVRLSDAGRVVALGLSSALASAKEPASASELRARMRAVMLAAGVDVAYAEVVDPASLVPLGDEDAGEGRALVAGLVEGVRLLDNGPVRVIRGNRATSH
ncbi:MAG: pantoate--beta-alanine ligase [Acidobacteriota bacterium]|nr:pantoate--beta-alanine ligase [Acidobacteriota bacterium]